MEIIGGSEKTIEYQKHGALAKNTHDLNGNMYTCAAVFSQKNHLQTSTELCWWLEAI